MRLLLLAAAAAVSLCAQIVVLNGTDTLSSSRPTINSNFAWLRDNKAALSHVHLISDITGLQAALDGKASSSHNHNTVYAALAHVHLVADVTGLQAALDGKAASTHNHDSAYSAVGHNHDSAYAAASHTHTIANVTNLQTTLDGKSATTHNHDATYAPISHNHAASAITSGVFPVARLGTGTPDGTKFLRDDGVFVVPSGGGGFTVASQAEAEAGTENTKGMTPLRVKQALVALGAAQGGDGIICDPVSGGWECRVNNASVVRLATPSTTVPGSCTVVGMIHIDTDASSGAKLSYCNGSTYEQITGSGGGTVNAVTAPSTIATDAPVLGNAADRTVKAGSRTGNTTEFGTWTGAKTTGKQLGIDANGNLYSSSFNLGAGSGTGPTSLCAFNSAVAFTSTAQTNVPTGYTCTITSGTLAAGDMVKCVLYASRTNTSTADAAAVNIGMSVAAGGTIVAGGVAGSNSDAATGGTSMYRYMHEVFIASTSSQYHFVAGNRNSGGMATNNNTLASQVTSVDTAAGNLVLEARAFWSGTLADDTAQVIGGQCSLHRQVN